MLRFYLALIVLFWPVSAQESPDQILKRAIEAHQSGDVERAIQGYRKYLQIRPDSPDVRSNLGAALSKSGRYDDAITEYQAALKRGPRNARIWLNLALAYYKSGQISKAADELTGLHAAQPGDRQVTVLLADCQQQLGDDLKVIELLTPIERQNQNDLTIAYLLGTSFLRSKQPERGQQMIDRIMRKGDSAEARLLMGTAKMNALDFNGATAELEKAVELNPNLPGLHSYLGRAYMETGNMSAARVSFEKELQQNPNDFESNLTLGMLLRQDQDYAGSRQRLDRALRVRPGELRVLYQIATVDLALGKLEAARTNLEQILKEAPDFAEAHISLATIYYRQKRKADGDRERAIVQRLNEEKRLREAAEKPE
jgi:tetratricopeptide (TPR) repeat protein